MCYTKSGYDRSGAVLWQTPERKQNLVAAIGTFIAAERYGVRMKTKQGRLCILLVAAMALSMLLSGCSNEEKTAEKIRPTRARDESTVPTETEAPTEPHSPLPEYLEILTGIMESSGYAEANNQQEFRGKLCDWDEDGEDEMLLRYGTDESLFEIWDYVNNSAVRTLSGSFGVNAGPGIHAHLYVVTYGEQPAIVLFDQKGGGGDSFTQKPLWSLYALVGDELQCMHQAGLVDAYDTQHDTSTKTFTLDGKDIPEAEFNAIDWVIKDAPPLFAAGRAYEDENGQITDGSYEFADLSDEIKAAIAAENGETPALSKADAMSLYLAVVREKIESTGYPEDTWSKTEHRGKLCDINNDGSDELLLRYVQDYAVTFEVYDIINGAAKCEQSGEFGYLAGGGNTSKLFYISLDDVPYLLITRSYGETSIMHYEYSLYEFPGKSGISKRAIKTENVDLTADSWDTAPRTITYTLNDEEITEEEFNKLPWVVTPDDPIFLFGSGDNDSDGSYEFEDLVKYLEDAIAAENEESLKNDPDTLVEDAFSYEDTSTPDFPHTFAIPKINIDSSEIDDLNTQIYDEMYPTIQDEIDGFEENGFWFYDNISYEWAVNEDVLSLMIHWDLPAENGAGKWDIYNISVSGKCIMTKEELLSAYGISEADYREKVKQALVSAYLDYAMGTYYDANGADDFFLKQLDKTGADSNIDAAQPFINEDGQLCMIGERYSLVEGDSYPCLLNLETFELSEYYGTDFTAAAAEDVNAIYEDFLANGTYLTSWESGDVDFGDPTSCCIQDLNNDGSPELCLSVPTFNGYYFTKLYTYDAKAKEVTPVGDFYCYGSLNYSEKYNAICANTLGPTMGGANWLYVQLQGTKLVNLFDLSESYSASGYAMASSAETIAYYYRERTGDKPKFDILSDPNRDSYEISEKEYKAYADADCTTLSFDPLPD